MELTFAWFWLLTLAKAGIGIYIGYKVIECHLSSKFWNIAALVYITLVIMSPLKIDGTNSKEFKTVQEQRIVTTKTLPPKVESKGFQKISTEGIAEEDLK